MKRGARQHVAGSIFLWVAATINVAGCGQSIAQNVSISNESIADAANGWNLRARRRGGLMPAPWELVSHDADGAASASNAEVLGRFVERNATSGAHVYLRPFAFRFRQRDTHRNVWARLVPLDELRSRMSLTELADLLLTQLRSEPPLVASLYARSEGGLVGYSGFIVSDRVATPIPAFGEYATSTRVNAAIAVTGRRDASVDGAAAHMLLAHINATLTADDAGDMANDAARGIDPVPPSSRLALTLIRLPRRVAFTTVERSYDCPAVLVVAYWAPTDAFAAGVDDYLSVIARLRIRER